VEHLAFDAMETLGFAAGMLAVPNGLLRTRVIVF
jgi:hypothetical protein